MQSDWQNFTNALKQETDLDVRREPLLTFPAGFSLLAVSGNDRQTFLHSQLINDLKLIENTGAQYSAWCNPKGQVIVNFLVINTGTSYLLLFRSDLADYVIKRLRMFVLRADVSIEDITENTPLLGLANHAMESNSQPGTVTANDGVITVSLPDTSGRYLLLANAEALTARTSSLLGTVKATPASTWTALDIYAGIPWISNSTQEKFLPQMLNLDALHALSYQKGCYPGQEVIARLHYRGEVKRRLQLIQTSSNVSEGELIKTTAGDNAGTVINTCMDTNGDSVSLAVIDLDKYDDELYSESNSDNVISVLPLPYHYD